MSERHDVSLGADDTQAIGFSFRRMSDWFAARFQTAAAPAEQPTHDDHEAIDPFVSPLEEFH